MPIRQSVTLVILDGWGVSPIKDGNATLLAKTPFTMSLLAHYPKTLLHASSEEVGLPAGEMGNSEVGHLNLGTGRIAMQNLPRINKAIKDGSLFENEGLKKTVEHVKINNSAIHLIGLCSAGGIHSHIDHLFALIDFFKKNHVKNLFIDVITDGRDTPPKAALDYLSKIEDKIQRSGFPKISSVSGRYYAMDRDKHWDRTEKAYAAMLGKTNKKAKTAQNAISKAYQGEETDEFIAPVVISSGEVIKNRDAIIFFNFRADRSRQIWHKFTGSKMLKNCFFLSFTSYGYEPTPNCKVAFFTEPAKNHLAEILAKNDLSQIHIAETEKYPHVTYFFNGGIEKPFQNEKRILVPSPKVSTYDQKPEMAAKEITKKALSFILNSESDFAVINYANPDMVGHTGDFKATLIALETVDKCLQDLVEAMLNKKRIVLITADHGNAEQMINLQTGEVDKEHTTNPVFLILAAQNRKKIRGVFKDDDFVSFAKTPPTGLLADVAPTILELMGLDKPTEMTGMSLLNQLE